MLNRRSVFIYFLTFLAGMTLGIINPVISTFLVDHQINNILIGLISSLYFMSIAIGSFLAGRKILFFEAYHKAGFGLLLSIVSIILFPLYANIYFWCGLRVMMGIGIGFYLVGIQTLLHNGIEDSIKGTISGIYAFCFAIGLVFGFILGPWSYMINAPFPFYMAAFLLLINILLIMMFIKEKADQAATVKYSMVKRLSLPLHLIFAYGFSEATLFTLFPVYLLSFNIPVERMGMIIGLFVAGSIMGVLPISYLADKYDRRKVLATVVFLGTLFISIIISVDSMSSLLIASLFTGLVIGPIYPLALTLTIQGVEKSEEASGISLFMQFYGLGCSLGPLLSAYLMEVLGKQFIFSVSLVLFFLFLIRIVSTKQFRVCDQN